MTVVIPSTFDFYGPPPAYHGPRVQESGLVLIPGHAYSAPYEDVKLKAK